MRLDEKGDRGAFVLPAAEALLLRDRSVAAARNGIIIADARRPDMPMIDVNPAVERITGYAPAETLGRNCRIFQGADTDQITRAMIHAALVAGRQVTTTVLNYRRDGSSFWNELHISPVTDDEGVLTHYVGIIEDVSDRRALEERLRYDASHDALTGLPNRSFLTERIERALAGTVAPAAVLFVDLDGFKFINDDLGHDVGDQLLTVVADRLRSALAPKETLARFGGDEFVLLLEGGVDRDTALNAAGRLATALREPVRLGDRELSVTASVGVAIGAGPGAGHGDLLRHADVAMYQAKRRGKARAVVYEASPVVNDGERLRMEADLRRALERDELVLHYQPRVDLKSRRIAGFEALVRWNHPELGLVPPNAFIPLAEEVGLISPLGRWVLMEAARQMRVWTAGSDGFDLSWVSVNVSARQLQDPGLVGDVAEALAASGLPPQEFELEVTESAAIQDGETTTASLRALKALGVELAVDDFGAGHASLASFKRLPVDNVKIDRGFVAELGRQPDTAIVTAAITLAHALGLRATAEGVETPAQATRLRELGCDFGQGYLFAAALPAEQIPQLLARESAAIGRGAA